MKKETKKFEKEKQEIVAAENNVKYLEERIKRYENILLEIQGYIDTHQKEIERGTVFINALKKRIKEGK